MDTIRSRSGLADFVTQIFFVAVVIFILATSGMHAHSTLPDSMLETHLNRLNKPAVKTIQREDGEIVDCVDIKKQPAFDHPLLKNHNVQMRPSSVTEWEKNTTGLPIFGEMWRKAGDCPEGTIPIRRVQMSDLRRAASLESFGRRDTNGAQQEQAGVRLVRGSHHYYGARADINGWAIKVNDNEWSHSAIEISDKSGKNFIEAGNLVNHQLFGDGKLRLYTYWTRDGYHGSGCYNLVCPGFVQVSRRFILGDTVEPLSVYGGQQYVMTTEVHRDGKTGNWWLKILEESVGYWPKEVFEEGYQRAGEIKRIGSVLNTWPERHHTTTQMGSGHAPGEGMGKAAYFNNLEIFDDNNVWAPPDTPEMYADSENCYNAAWRGASSDVYLFFYGGPGDPKCSYP